MTVSSFSFASGFWELDDILLLLGASKGKYWEVCLSTHCALEENEKSYILKTYLNGSSVACHSEKCCVPFQKKEPGMYLSYIFILCGWVTFFSSCLLF